MNMNENNAFVKHLPDTETEESEFAQGDDNSFYIKTALSHSKTWIDVYQREHRILKSKLYPDADARLAMGLLDWILREGRKELRGKITANEMLVLCNALNGEMATPYDVSTLAGYVADEVGIEDLDYRGHPFAPLMDKLLGMPAIQKLALRELVQRFWYPVDGVSKSIDELLAEYDIIESDYDESNNS